MDLHDDVRWLREHMAELERHVGTLHKKADLIMSAQDDINAATARILATQATEAAAVSALDADVTAIGAALQAGGGTPVDTSALVAAVAGQDASDTALIGAVNDVTGLVPPAAQPPAPAAPGS
jgi:hypothetical protein